MTASAVRSASTRLRGNLMRVIVSSDESGEEAIRRHSVLSQTKSTDKYDTISCDKTVDLLGYPHKTHPEKFVQTIMVNVGFYLCTELHFGPLKY